MNKGVEDSYFGLAIFMLVSARNLVDEPKFYGPLRLLESASRLSSLSERLGGAQKDQFLLAAKKKIDENMRLVGESEEKFVAFLDDLIRDFTRELKKRNRLD